MNATDRATLAALQGLAIDGVATVSVRRLAEIIGRTRTTASASLRRLIEGGLVVRFSEGKCLQSGRYGVPSRPENRYKTWTTIEQPAGVPDLFRTTGLYGAGQLHTAAPKEVLMTVPEILMLGTTKSPGGAKAQLIRLESLPVPLASSQPDPTHRQRMLWMFHELTSTAEKINVAHLDELGGRDRPRYRLDQELLHLMEQEQYRARWGVEPFSVVADRDILPYVIEDPVKGCLLFWEQANGSGYGTVHPDHYGIGAHRVVWIADRGSVPSGHELHHECWERACVNVEHLRVLTEAEHRNVHRDADRASRMFANRDVDTLKSVG